MSSKRILLSHGSGGVETTSILEELILKKLSEKLIKVPGGYGLDVMDDSAAIPLSDGSFIVVSIDSYTVNPIVFPGGDLGVLAASGTINDVLMMGGRPIAVLDAIVVEEGFPLDSLESIVSSMLGVLGKLGIPLIGGDFKVMPRGQLDKVIITTAGIGIAEKPIVDTELRIGDKIIVTGTIGDHGATIMALQQGIEISSSGLKSDVKPLTDLMLPLLEKYRDYIHAARDPTRGGLAMLLNDWAKSTGALIIVDEEKIPVREPVRVYSEMLGIDPLALASEGVAVLGVDPDAADEILEFIKYKLGYEDASIIGEVRSHEKYKGLVVLETVSGSYRVLDPPRGELVPRIC